MLRSCANCATPALREGPNDQRTSSPPKYNIAPLFERMAVDILGLLPVTKRRNQYLLVVQDYFTKWSEYVFLRFGVPLELHSDQGRNFDAAVFQEMTKFWG
ncbi:hypothetical protein PR048_017644 [Dryococelus australis]|uniref:Integrase catalytic domain-containing protein n=1 Tax=Dryococelus australis TaxID=614101 RepID=A0ABQ9HA95_9NEOP|nr:hypothetical protein PR048_017644 [Dryococelus australis]